MYVAFLSIMTVLSYAFVTNINKNYKLIYQTLIVKPSKLFSNPKVSIIVKEIIFMAYDVRRNKSEKELHSS